MPNLVMEYTNTVEERVNVQGLIEDLHQVAIDSCLFDVASIKSRTLRCDHWLMGSEQDESDFIHITFELLDGRSEKQKKELSCALMAVLLEQASQISSLTINIRDMDRNSFQKVMN
ncbi:5-carboxymethyl-2-hydroxymuconate isomerase [Vibrio sp. FNV 38]|nr:5-carboxymethyl-2-hydroxymuconate isomerase [Vibrio sp. FNV 38]